MPEIEIIRERISTERLRSFLGHPFFDMVKFVVDVDRNILALGGELHADAEAVLLADGSEQQNLWGGNIYPDAAPDDRVEYTSLINIRPSQGDRSLEVQNEETRNRIKKIVETLIEL